VEKKGQAEGRIENLNRGGEVHDWIVVGGLGRGVGGEASQYIKK